MNSLKIPDNGLTLKGSAGDIGPLPPQAFAISLNDSVIEGMIKCVQDGGDIQLALGAKPVSLRISTSTPCCPRLLCSGGWRHIMQVAVYFSASPHYLLWGLWEEALGDFLRWLATRVQSKVDVK